MGPHRARRGRIEVIHNRRVRRALAAAVEPLPPRTMLSVDLGGDGVLRIVGSETRDDVVLAANPNLSTSRTSPLTA